MEFEMDLAKGYRPKNEIKVKRPNREIIGPNNGNILVIKLPASIVLRILSRSLFVAMFILALPSIRSILKRPQGVLNSRKTVGCSSADVDLVPLLIRDLLEKGLVNRVDRALVMSSDFENFVDCFGLLEDNEVNEIDLVLESDLGSKSVIYDGSFDCVFALSSGDGEFEDRMLKTGGILVTKLSNDSSNPFQRPSNYKIVYVRKFNSTIVAMRKMARSIELRNIEKKDQICGQSEAKKAAVKSLEDALFEPPPSRELAKSSEIKFLADLVGNSLESYNRRIFITDEIDNIDVLSWFHQNYPKKKQEFEEIKTNRMASWIKRNVKEEDFVVVKAEAQLVEEMMREKTICLVDELFLECEFQGHGVWEGNKGKKAYWECLTLFGKLREEGVSVHQWWG